MEQDLALTVSLYYYCVAELFLDIQGPELYKKVNS
jgi:hypothetical protein